MADSTLYDEVNKHYSSIAREKEGDNAEHMKKVALSFGYSAEDLAAIPGGANLGVSCGNPLALAGLKAGETVIDLGSGAGFDVFQASRKVGTDGLSIGVDMSEDMLNRARANATKSSIINVKFVLAQITSIPLESNSADCIISNCVINLVPHSDKHLVFNEIYRLLKPGGRVAVSDILAKKDLSPDLQNHLGLYVGCISGASLVSDYEKWLKEAGFNDIMIVNKHADLNIYKERSQEETACGIPIALESDTPDTLKAAASSYCGSGSTSSSCCKPKDTEVGSKEAPSSRSNTSTGAGVAHIDFNEWVGSFNIYAVKPDNLASST